MEPIEQAAGHLEEVGAERLRVLNRVRVVEKERDQLQSAKLEAEEYQAKERDIATKQAHVAQLERARNVEKLEARTAGRAKLATKQEAERAKLADLSKQMEDVKVHCSASSALCTCCVGCLVNTCVGVGTGSV